jgi:hypothetical protein
MTVLKPLFLQSGSHPARDVRMALQATLGQPTSGVTRAGGVVPGFGGQLFCQQNGTPNMTVLVSSGAVLAPGTASATQGSYPFVNDAQISVNIAASHASLPRIDVIAARIKDTQYGDASNEAVIEVVTGTPAGSPAVPALNANSVKLFEVAVAAGVTTIVNGNLTDRRVWAVSVGGVHPCLSTARPSSPYEGLTIYETDTDLIAAYNGSTWKYHPPRQAALILGRTSGSFQSIPNNTLTAAQFNNVERNVGGWSAGTPVTTVTVPTGMDGEYLVDAYAPFAADPDGAQRVAQVFYNGAVWLDARNTPISGGGGTLPTPLHVSSMRYLAAGDTIRMDVFHDAGASLNLGFGAAPIAPRLVLKRLSDA